MQPSEMPANTCKYDQYDLNTLEPLNSHTYVRLDELGWTEAEFRGKTVLDIGANSGLLTLHSLRLGASTVHACEIQAPLAAFVEQVAEQHQLSVTVSKTPFIQLTREEHAADVVLFMEVLHWVVSKGMPLREAITRLAQLTQELLYLEFPWSVEEPSIRLKTSLTEETYSTDAVLDELTKYFTDVRVVRFMHYLGYGAASKRILVRAQGKRPEADLLAALSDTYSLDRSLARTNESYLLTSPRGQLVGKVLGIESRLSTIPADVRMAIFSALQEADCTTIVGPELIGDDFLLTAPDGRNFMLLPFITPPRTTAQPSGLSVHELIAVFANVRSDFRKTRAPIREMLAANLGINVDGVRKPTAAWRRYAKTRLPVAWLDELLSYAVEPGLLDSLNHRDLQTGNMIFDSDRAVRVVDMDNIGVGTIYSDGLLGLMWRGGSASDLADLCGLIGTDESRVVEVGDLVVAMANGLEWYASISKMPSGSSLKRTTDRFVEGVHSAMEFHSGHAWN